MLRWNRKSARSSGSQSLNCVCPQQIPHCGGQPHNINRLHDLPLFYRGLFRLHGILHLLYILLHLALPPRISPVVYQALQNRRQQHLRSLWGPGHAGKCLLESMVRNLPPRKSDMIIPNSTSANILGSHLTFRKPS